MTALTPEQIETGARLLEEVANDYRLSCEKRAAVRHALATASEAEGLRNKTAALETNIASVMRRSDHHQARADKAEQEAEALRAEVGRLREAVDKTREAFDEVWPFYEGEHYYDHPCSVRVRALIEAADALASPIPQPAAQEDTL